MKTRAIPLLAVLMVAFPAFAQSAADEIGQWMGRVLVVVVLALAGWGVYSRQRAEIAERKRQAWRRRMLEQETGDADAPVADTPRRESDA